MKPVDTIFATNSEAVVALGGGAAARLDAPQTAEDSGPVSLNALPRTFRVRVPVAPADVDRGAYLAAKRIFDLLVVGASLVLTAPLLLLIAVAIRLEGKGPILYRQARVGQHGRRIMVLKFRTMIDDRRHGPFDRRERRRDRRRRRLAIEFADRRHARSDGGRDRRGPCRPGAVGRRRTLKSGRDPRVTRIGRILRSTSLDELPQLFNILRGEMSLVGPRPEQLDMLEYYSPEHYRRHEVVPGLTGWWQISSRCTRPRDIAPEEDLRQKLADDVYYLEHRSFWFDLRVILWTVPVVLARRGAF